MVVLIILSSPPLPNFQAREAHEGQRDQAGRHQSDGEAFKTLGTLGKLHALTHTGKQNNGKQETNAAGNTIGQALTKVIGLLRVLQGHTQHGTVGGLSLIHI